MHESENFVRFWTRLWDRRSWANLNKSMLSLPTVPASHFFLTESQSRVTLAVLATQQQLSPSHRAPNTSQRASSYSYSTLCSCFPCLECTNSPHPEHPLTSKVRQITAANNSSTSLLLQVKEKLRSRHSVVGIATGYGLDDEGSEFKSR
jgi:hypothetical protein